jgi:Zn-finger nucleic acid-binding protein
MLEQAQTAPAPRGHRLRLVACSNCHTQYDVTDVSAKTVACRCGEAIDARPRTAVEAAVERCGACGASVASDAEQCAYCASPIVRDPDALSLICPECFARSSDESRFCTACGIPFRPETVRVDGHEFPCPVCTKLMPPRQIGGIALNECEGCHGLWTPGDGFDALVARAIDARQNASAAELQRLKPRVTGSNPAAQRVQYRKCPECDGFMQRTNYRKKSGIIIDRCVSHGTWLDADELEQIAGFILSGAKGAEVPRENAADRQRNANATKAFVQIQHQHAPPRHEPEEGLVESLFGLLSGILR